MSMNEPCPICKKLIPISDIINNCCSHCGSKPPEGKKKEEEAIATESSLLYPDSPPSDEEQPPPPIIAKKNGLAPTEGELIGQLRGKVARLENMVNGASVERLKMGRELKSLRQEIDTLGGRIEQFEIPDKVEDWEALAKSRGFQSEKEMLSDMYSVKKLSMEKIGKELKVSKFIILKRMNKHGLERRRVGLQKK